MTVQGPFGFNGGWNAKTGPYDCAPNAYVDAQNMELSYGHMVKKNGNSVFAGASSITVYSAIEALYFFQDQFVVTGAAGTKGIGTTTGGTITDITGSTNPGGLWMASLNNLLEIGGTGYQIQWSGSGNCTQYINSNSPNPPSTSKCGCVANNYMFVGNFTKDAVAHPHGICWSNPEDPTNWPATSYVDIDPNDSSHSVVAVFPFGQNVLVFKDNLIALFYTQATNGTLGPVVILTEEYGIAGRNCVDRLPDGRIAFFASNSHVYIFDGNSFTDISDQPPPGSNIQPVLNSLLFGISNIGEGCLRVYQSKNQIWISAPFQFTNALGTTFSAGTTFIYDIQLGIWLSQYPDHAIFTMVDNLANTPYEQLISGGYGQLFQEDVGQTNQDPIGSGTLNAYVTKSIPSGPDAFSFVPRSAYIPFNAGVLQASFCYGYNGYNNPPNYVSITSSVSPAVDQKKVVILPTPSAGWNTGQFRFDGGSVSQAFTLSPFYLSDQVEVQI